MDWGVILPNIGHIATHINIHCIFGTPAQFILIQDMYMYYSLGKAIIVEIISQVNVEELEELDWPSQNSELNPIQHN